jgi:hypothetical protein
MLPSDLHLMAELLRSVVQHFRLQIDSSLSCLMLHRSWLAVYRHVASDSETPSTVVAVIVAVPIATR